MLSIRSKLVTGAAIGAAAIGGGAIASAATSGSASTAQTAATTSLAAPPQGAPPSFDPSKGGHTANGRTEKLLTGDTAAKVRAAATAKVSGTVERVETNVDSSAPYEAHIRKSDGTEVEVQVTKDFKVAAVNEMGPMGSHP
jgi:ABC-type transport system substrate-binding protein